MADVTVKYRRPLNDQQIAVLELVFRFRFSTARQIATGLKRDDHKSIQKKLQILEERGFIAKRYDKTYKLQGRPAEYFLTLSGVRELERRHPELISANAVKALYKNKTVSQEFVAHCIHVTETAHELTGVYGEELSIVTKTRMFQLDVLPTWKSDLFIDFVSDEGIKRQYFLDVWDDTTPFFLSYRKARNYLNFKDEGVWPKEFRFPNFLMVCDTVAQQKKLARQIRSMLGNAWEWGMAFGVTTRAQLKSIKSKEDRIWLKVEALSEFEEVALWDIYPMRPE